ncbi:MAG: maleylpyruvate isomerase family mycothiol-dependent enzyme, partial [Acidimicrobiales bacterium]
MATARAAIDYLTGRDESELSVAIPNCPGWNVYNAAVHVARVCVAWEAMMACQPDDTTARDRAYEVSGQKPTGASLTELAQWAHSCIDRMSGDPDEVCYFSMAGGPGTTGMWAWHAAAEIGVHRLDVESALGQQHAMTDAEAVDGATYVAEIVTGALRRMSGEDPGAVSIELLDRTGTVAGTADVPSEGSGRVAVRGPAMSALLALWG